MQLHDYKPVARWCNDQLPPPVTGIAVCLLFVSTIVRFFQFGEGTIAEFGEGTIAEKDPRPHYGADVEVAALCTLLVIVTSDKVLA